MALIKCPECGGSLSASAPVCIHCGMQIALYRLSHQNEAIRLYDQARSLHNTYIEENSFEDWETGEKHLPSQTKSPAVEYLKEAVKYGLGAAARLLAVFYREDNKYDEAISYFELADSLGCHIMSGDAWYVEWGEMYCGGGYCSNSNMYYDRRNYLKAIELFEKALQSEVGEAAYDLGRIYDPTIRPDFQRSFYYEPTPDPVEWNRPEANLEKAKEYYRMAAKSDHEIAFFDYKRKAIDALKHMYFNAVAIKHPHFTDCDYENARINEHILLEGPWEEDEVHLYVKEYYDWDYDRY